MCWRHGRLGLSSLCVLQDVADRVLCASLRAGCLRLLIAVAGITAAQGRLEVWCQLLKLCEAASKQQGDEAA